MTGMYTNNLSRKSIQDSVISHTNDVQELKKITFKNKKDNNSVTAWPESSINPPSLVRSTIPWDSSRGWESLSQTYMQLSICVQESIPCSNVCNQSGQPVESADNTKDKSEKRTQLRSEQWIYKGLTACRDLLREACCISIASWLTSGPHNCCFTKRAPWHSYLFTSYTC